MALFQLTNGFNALFGHAICRSMGSDILFFSDLKHLQAVVIDFSSLVEGTVRRIALEFHENIHQTTSVNDVIWRIQNAQFFELISMTRLSKNIVRTARDDFGFQFANCW